MMEKGSGRVWVRKSEERGREEMREFGGEGVMIQSCNDSLFDLAHFID